MSVFIEWVDEDFFDVILELCDEDFVSVVVIEVFEINEVVKILSDVNLNVDFNDIGFSEVFVISDVM